VVHDGPVKEGIAHGAAFDDVAVADAAVAGG
jgi:hypothetical protein